MHWQCEECERIHKYKYTADACCPRDTAAIHDSEVVYCLKCHGDGCGYCGDRGILLAWEAQRKDALRALWVTCDSPAPSGCRIEAAGPITIIDPA